MAHYSNEADAVKEFQKKFQSKTQNKWDNRDQFVPKAGKYTLLEMEDDEEDDQVILNSHCRKYICSDQIGWPICRSQIGHPICKWDDQSENHF